MANEANIADQTRTIPSDPVEAYRLGFEDGKQDAFELICEWTNGPREERATMVYFIQAETGGPVKVGMAKDPQSRLKTLQTSHHEKLCILATCSGGLEQESVYHRRFAEHRLEGEWFEPHPDILAEIERLTENQHG